MPSLEAELDRLFGVPLDEFTSARNELVRQLKAAKDVEAAARVQALAKPTVPVWTINQLSRREPDAVQALLDAGAALRKAQAHLLGHGGGSDVLRDAAAEERQALQRLTQHAEVVLKDAGRPATAAVLERVGRTLQAAAVTDEWRPALKAGRLTEELEPPGFDAFAGGEVVARSPARATDELAERRRRRDEERRRKRELQQRAHELERAAREAEREADRAEATAADARRAADEARAAADEAEAELAELE